MRIVDDEETTKVLKNGLERIVYSERDSLIVVNIKTLIIRNF